MNKKAVIQVTLGILIAYLLWISIRLKVNYFDSYSIFLNAKAIAQGTAATYFWKRPPLLPLALSPLFYLESKLSLTGLAEVSARMLAVLFFLLLMGMTYNLIRLHLKKETALWAPLLLGLNTLLIHYAPFCKEDIPGAFLTTAALYFYLKIIPDNKTKYFILTSLFIAAAVMTRYHLAPLIFFIIACHEILNGKLTSLLKPKKMFAFFLVPTCLFFITPVVIYGAVNIIPWSQAPAKFLDELSFFLNLVSGDNESPVLNIKFLAKSVSWPVFLIAGFGFIQVWRNRENGRIIHTLWFWTILVFHSFAVGHKEARFLFPLLPPLYYFAAYGLSDLSQKLRNKHKLFSNAALCGILAFPVFQALKELSKFQDPFYTTAQTQNISQSALRMANDKRIYWVGEMYPLVPRDHVFHPMDKKTYIYDIYNHAINFYTNKRISVLNEANFLYPSESKEDVFVEGIGNYVNHGDILIINTEPTAYSTRNLPNQLNPLIVKRIKKFKLRNFAKIIEPSFEGENGQSLSRSSVKKSGIITELARTFETPAYPDAEIQISGTDNEYEIFGTGFPSGFFEFYFLFNNEELAESYPIFKFDERAFNIHIKKPLESYIAEVYLVNYEQIGQISLPDKLQANNLIGKDKKVKMEFKLIVDGELKHHNKEAYFVQGDGKLLPKLAEILEGLQVGDSKKITINPEDAYGNIDPSAFAEIQKEMIPRSIDLKIGAALEIETNNGLTAPATISSIDGDKIILDFNHPLAGKTLNYEVKILEIK